MCCQQMKWDLIRLAGKLGPYKSQYVNILDPNVASKRNVRVIIIIFKAFNAIFYFKNCETEPKKTYLLVTFFLLYSFSLLMKTCK